ncbi:MAG: Sigma-70, region 4, partial [Paenibacillus sp.]|nr:Sigma-70, region 4 [Paenibacillus sp.]
YYYENYSTAEIAQLLGKRESTIRTQLKRARELLKTRLIGGLAHE